MKKIMLMVGVILVLGISVSGCGNKNNKEAGISSDTKVEKKVQKDKKKVTKQNIQIENQEKELNNTPKLLEEFLGKPTLIFFLGTYCPHCQSAIPNIEKDIWDVYKDDMNIFVNVIDKKKFSQKRINQGYKEGLNFAAVTGKECGYVPSWVLIDKNGKVSEEGCGKADVSEIITKIKSILGK